MSSEHKLEMADVVRAHLEVSGCPVLTSNQCHAIAMKLNEMLTAPAQPGHSAQHVAVMTKGPRFLSSTFADAALDLSNGKHKLYAHPLDTVQEDAQSDWTDERKLALKTALQLVAAEERLATAERLLRDTMSELRNPLHTDWEDCAADRIEAYLAASEKPEDGEV